MHNPKRLYLFVGYPGAGKTTVARLIAEHTGAVHLWADNERQTMFGQATHSASESQQLYKYLNDKTATLLDDGHSVIFDTNFNFRRDREWLQKIATEHGAETVIVWITTPLALAKQRATQNSDGVDTRIWGNMSAETFDRISNNLQPPTEDEHAYSFDGTAIDPDDVIKKLQLDV